MIKQSKEERTTTKVEDNIDSAIKELKPLMDLEPLRQEVEIKKIANKYKGITITNLRKQLSKMIKDKEINEAVDLIKNKTIENSDYLIKEPLPPTSLAIGKKNNVFYYGKKVIGANNQLRNSIITSDKQFLINKSYKMKNILIGENQIKPLLGEHTSDLALINTFSIEAIKRFLTGKHEVKLVGLFNKIKRQFEKYYDFPNQETYLLCTAYTLMTYLYILFPAVPYLEFNAGKGSGKSKLMDIFVALSFNSELSTSHTESTLFRAISSKRGLFAIDEFEPIKRNNMDGVERAIERILNSGYKVGGKIPRTEKYREKYILRYYNTYCPKLIASVGGIMSPTLKSRCIKPLLLKTLKEQGKKQPNFEDSIWGEIRDDCFIWALNNWKKIETTYYNLPLDNELFNNRDRELWKPLLSIIKEVSEDYFDKLKSYSEKLIKRSQITNQETETRELQLLNCLLEILTEKEKEVIDISPKDISTSMPTYKAKDGSERPIMNSTSIGIILTRWGIEKGRGKKGRTEYKIKQEEIKNLIKRLFSISEPKTPPNPETSETSEPTKEVKHEKNSDFLDKNEDNNDNDVCKKVSNASEGSKGSNVPKVSKVSNIYNKNIINITNHIKLILSNAEKCEDKECRQQQHKDFIIKNTKAFLDCSDGEVEAVLKLMSRDGVVNNYEDNYYSLVGLLNDF